MSIIRYLYIPLILVGILAILVWFGYQQYVDKPGEIHIALAGPLSGVSASNGKSYEQAIQLLLDSINAKGGIEGKQLVLDEYDDQNNCEQLAEQKAREIVKDNRALAVIGHNYSECSIKAGNIYQQYNIPAITPSSTDVSVTANRPWYFRTIFNDKSQGRFLAYYVHHVLQRNAVSIILKDSNYSTSLVKVFEETAQKLGIQIKYKWSFEADESKFESRAIEIVNELATKSDAGLIFLAAHAPEGAKLVQLIRDNKISNKIVGPDSFSVSTFQNYFQKLSQEKMMPGFYTNGIYMTVPLIFDSAHRVAQDFREVYYSRYQAEPDWHAAFAYDAAMIIVEALKKGDVVGEPDTIEADRQRIKAYFSQQINSHEQAVIGVTGANYFNESGDPPFKSISVGVFRGGKIISAPTQLQDTHQLTAITNLDTTLRKGQVIMFNDVLMRKVNVVYTGVDVRKISELDTDNLTYTLDFLLWFRYSDTGNFSPQEVQFTNALESIDLGEPIDFDLSSNSIYKLYHVVGRFKAELSPNYYLFGQHTLSMKLRHRSLTRDQLIYVTDVLGMQDEKTMAHRLRNSQTLIIAPGWFLDSVHFSQATLLESTLGRPDYLNASNGDVEYSSFVMDLRIQKNEFSPRAFFGTDTPKRILVISVILLLLLSLLNHLSFVHFPKTILLLQAVIVYAILLSGEIATLNQVAIYTDVYYLQTITIVTITFDVLWWVVSAVLLHLAIEHFIWLPLERSTGRKIPNVIRSFFAFIVYTLAFFGIIAFVFNQALTSLLATSGVIAMIIGLAVQVNISNIFSGIALNIEHPFRVGDWIKIGDSANAPDAKVINITWRTTRVQLRNNAVLSIPNSTMAESKIINYSYPETIQEMTVQVNIDPNHNPESVEKILIDAALSCKSVLRTPAPYVLFKGINEWSASYRLIVCSDNYARWSRIYKEVWQRVWVHLNRAGIGFAIKQQKIHIFKGIGERGEEATKPVTLLKEIEIFTPFSEEDKQQLSEKMQLQHFTEGNVIVEQGQQGDSLFIIVEGIVSVQVRENIDGNALEVARLGAGNFFGEMALLMGTERAATVIAVTDTYVYEITKETLEPFLFKQPEVSKLISRILTSRQMATQSQMDNRQPSENEKQSVYEQFLSRIENFFGLRKT